MGSILASSSSCNLILVDIVGNDVETNARTNLVQSRDYCLAMGFNQKMRGGKKGMKQNNGVKRSGVKLRPAPQQSTNSTLSNQQEQEGNREEDEDDNDEEYDESRHFEEKKPLCGCIITVSGCSEIKNDLLKMCESLGAKSGKGLTADVTHLITDSSGSPKYEVSCNLIPFDFGKDR